MSHWWLNGMGPCHIPAKMTFSAFMRTPGGRLVTLSRMGQIDCFEELKSCTPSEHKIRPVCSGTARKPPGSASFRYASLSCMSWILPSTTFLVNGYWSWSHLSKTQLYNNFYDINTIVVVWSVCTCKNRFQMLLKGGHSIIAETGIFAVLATVLVLHGDFIQKGGANFFSVRVAMSDVFLECIELVG